MKTALQHQLTIHEKITQLFDKFFSFFLFLKPYIFNFFMFIFTFLSPVLPIVIATILVIGLDSIMGIWKAKFLYKTKNQSKPNSNNFKKGFVPKAILYTTLILVGFILDKLILNEFVSYFMKTTFSVKSNFISTKILALILISIEAQSIDENFIEIFGISLRKKLVELIKKIKEPLSNLLDNKKK